MTLYQRVAYITPEGANYVTPQASGGTSLGSGLFITPRAFTYNTYAGPGVFNLPDQGLVGIVASDPTSPWGKYDEGGYRIVTKADGTMDAQPFAQAMAALSSYGSADEGVSVAALQAQCRIRPAEMRCDLTIAFVRACAAQVGLQSREVDFLTATTPNDFDDGHVACELRASGSAWQLFDIANDLAWQNSSGTILSTVGAIDAGISNCVRLNLATTRCGRATAPGATSWISADHHMAVETPAQQRSWCERICQICGIEHTDGLTYFYLPPGTEGRASWVLGLSSNNRIVDHATLLAMFYA